MSHPSPTPSMDDFRYEDVIALLRSGKHAPLLGAYFGEEQYRDLCALTNRPPVPRRAGAPVVYVLPGVMGSKLGRGDGTGARLLWLNARAIEAGHLGALAHPTKSPLHAVGVLLGGYLKIRLALELEGFEVRYFAYDWRADLEVSARRLLAQLASDHANNCTLIAHSMGGLVARVALSLAPPSVIGRVIQLGTPNLGAYTPLQAMRAVYPTVRKLSALDPHRSTEDLARQVFLTLSGLYQMLPSQVPPATMDLLDVNHWPGDDLRAHPAELARAREVRKLLAPADERAFCICGVSQETITGVRVTADGFEYTYTRNGDGTVPTAMSRWENARTWYANANHGALTIDKTVIAATAELLSTGDCRTLSSQAPPVSTEITRVVTDKELRAPALRKVRWDELPIVARRAILEPVMMPEFLA